MNPKITPSDQTITESSKLQVEGSVSNLPPSNLEPSNLPPSNLEPSNLPPSNLQPSNLQPSNLQPVTDIAISVRNVSKMYPLYAKPGDRLKQSLWYALPGFMRGQPRQFYREFWALRDISFEVKRGEALGIIGRNGSGKSTLLQIIAGTLAPTTGQVQVNGRVAALLELGSGFNPEFTGRENVYLNGSILGFSREEMDNLFDEIAAFADIGQFMDQPVKLYSSGMFVRLAFAVQACVNPDVLIVDEALAVGDIFFQQKCHGRIERLLEECGTAVLLVTHDMGTVQKYCRRAILLDQGQPLFNGNSAEAVKRYFSLKMSPVPDQLPNDRVKVYSKPLEDIESSELSFWPEKSAFIDFSSSPSIGEGWARCTAIALCDASGNPYQVFQQGQRAYFYYEFEALRDLYTPSGGVVITDSKNIIVHGKSSFQYLLKSLPYVERGKHIRFRQSIVLNLTTTQYTFDVTLTMMKPEDYANLAFMPGPELLAKISTLVRINQAGTFSIIPSVNDGVSIKHTGICDLPGDCEIGWD